MVSMRKFGIGCVTVIKRICDRSLIGTKVGENGPQGMNSAVCYNMKIKRIKGEPYFNTFD